MLFKSGEGYSVILETKIYNKMKEFCKEAYPKETGGILIGRYSDDQDKAIVMEVTHPHLTQKLENRKFLRSKEGIINKLNDAWVKEEYYLGEWHYHPNGNAKPSIIDEKQMFELAKNKDLNCPEPILIIVGDYEERISVTIFENQKEIRLLEYKDTNGSY